jgi:hypothetical protein
MLISIFVFLNFFIYATSALAASSVSSVMVAQPSNLPSQFTDVNKLYGFIFNTFIGISGSVFIVMILVGGFWYLTSQGNDELATKGKKMIINALIGIGIVAAAWALGTFILKSINLI